MVVQNFFIGFLVLVAGIVLLIVLLGGAYALFNLVGGSKLRKVVNVFTEILWYTWIFLVAFMMSISCTALGAYIRHIVGG